MHSADFVLAAGWLNHSQQRSLSPCPIAPEPQTRVLLRQTSNARPNHHFDAISNVLQGRDGDDKQSGGRADYGEQGLAGPEAFEQRCKLQGLLSLTDSVAHYNAADI